MDEIRNNYFCESNTHKEGAKYYSPDSPRPPSTTARYVIARKIVDFAGRELECIATCVMPHSGMVRIAVVFHTLKV